MVQLQICHQICVNSVPLTYFKLNVHPLNSDLNQILTRNLKELLMFILLILLLMVFKTSCREHSHWARERGREGIPLHPLLNQTRSNSFCFKVSVSVSKCFLQLFINNASKRLHYFNHVCCNVETIYGGSSLFATP